MNIKDFFIRVKPTWLERVSNHLSAEERVRDSFSTQLMYFYDEFIEAVAQGAPSLVEPIIKNWIDTKTEADFDPEEKSIYTILSRVLLITCDIATENLEPREALLLNNQIIALYTQLFEFGANYEESLDLQHLAYELTETKTAIAKLEESKSNFISIAAHELRTPLTLIEGYASMLKDVIPEQYQTEQANVCLNGIQAGTTRLREIVDDLIDASLIENKLLTLNYQPLWLNRLLHQVYRDVKTTILERRLTLEISPFPGSDEMIFADGERLYQAFHNVISNAIKFTPDGGRITVDGRILPGFIETTIADTGIGIDPEDHIRIFEKFGGLGNVSLHSSGKLKFMGGGPGLGLPITRGIIQAHNGSIWVESSRFDVTNCPGSTFHILIPARKSPPDENAAQLFHPLIEKQKF
jgi:signal transduction histidine kinase